MKSRIQDYLLSLVFTVFIISFSVCFVIFFKPFYTLEVNLLHIDQMVDLSKSTILHNYSQLIDYQSIFYKGKLVLDDFTMSTQGRIHFEEVKRIFEYIQYTCIVSGIISIVGIYINTKKKEYRYLSLTSILSITIPLILGFIVSLNFDAAFIKMHQLLFNNDYWLFNPNTDPVINILPDTFFYHCFIVIVVLIVGISVIMQQIYKRKYEQILLESKE